MAYACRGGQCIIRSMTSDVSDLPTEAASGGGVTRDDVICVVGAGSVGLVTAACLAEMGNTVRLLETDPVRLEALREGRAPIFEPGLEELLHTVIDEGRFEATDYAAAAVSGAGIVFIAVGTPSRPDGTADLSQVRTAAADVSAVAAGSTVLVIKSTVPPGTTASLRSPRPGGRPPLATVACPEFLREGSALEDFRSLIAGITRAAQPSRWANAATWSSAPWARRIDAITAAPACSLHGGARSR